jgi:arginine-tRNA-protein transferase
MSRSIWPALPPPRGIALTVLDEHPCPYLPDRMARNRAFVCQGMPPALYHQLMDAGFRRSGTLFYQPICTACRECRPIRVPVASFKPSKSQRRIRRRNQDLRVSVGVPVPTDEKFDLYARYCRQRHGREEADDPRGFVEFLYASPVNTIEVSYRDSAGRLIGVGLCDVCDLSLSSVYFYFDPDQAWRGVGTFGALWELDYAMRQDIAYYYLGFWIRACGTMSYKAHFRPCEVLWPDGQWRGLPLQDG